ncbi:energy-coupling factor ABC transporter ATP-binding protein, partial [Ruminococcus bromii]|uniref:energy-coupling factor ABC transporter ATP-binding protein n=1 Tax=Ruminococcus bromii TaxID=40518 RepID=UPI003FD80B19
NGMGKSTALSIICSLNKPYRGKVEISPLNKNSFDTLVAVLPQNPQTLFLKKTVLEDLYEVFDGRKISKKEKERRVTAAVKLCRLESLCNRHPYDLSGGEQQRAALAKILLIRPQILLLDEPTKGLDAEFKIEFAQIIYDLNKAGITVLMVSHDVEFCAVYPSRCLMFFNGEVVSEGTPRTFFSSNSFYSTSASRMSKGIIDNAVSSNDVIYACTGQSRDIQIDRNTPDIDLFKNDTENIPRQKNKAEIFWCSTVHTRFDCKSGIYSEFFSKNFAYLVQLGNNRSICCVAYDCFRNKIKTTD